MTVKIKNVSFCPTSYSPAVCLCAFENTALSQGLRLDPISSLKNIDRKVKINTAKSILNY